MRRLVVVVTSHARPSEVAHVPPSVAVAVVVSHRVFDVSTLIRAERTYGDSEGLVTVKADAHRALADARASLATARAFVARRFP